MGKIYANPPSLGIDPEIAYTASLSTDLGDMTFGLLPGQAPIAVNNFIFLAREGFYEGTPIHRLIPGFVAQAGSPDGAGDAEPGYLIEGELPKVGDPAQSSGTYPVGTLALAEYRREDDPEGVHTHGCQFFIALDDLDHMLLPNSPVLGRLSEGQHVIEGLNAIECDEVEERPLSPLSISSITISES